MVTVITTKEELTTSTHNGVITTGSDDNEHLSLLIRDYQEVNFLRTRSCKPLPEDSIGTVDGQVPESAIKGIFLLQIETIEPYEQINNNQKEQRDGQNKKNLLLLTLTDGSRTIEAITDEKIPNLNLNTKIGSKLLLTDTILIKNGRLELTNDNTRFQFGSSTYPRPRSANRGRTTRTSNDGRRNLRSDQDENDSSFMKRPPPKTTLLDFMKNINLSSTESDIDKAKEVNGNSNNRRNQHDVHSQSIKRNPHKQNYSTYFGMNNNHYPTGVENDQIVYQLAEIDETFDIDDESAQTNFRERRNPLPPRLQRIQSERSCRNPYRYHEEFPYPGNDSTGNLSMTSTYQRHDDHPSFVSTNPPMTYSAAAPILMPHPNMLTSLNGPTPTHMTYFPTNLTSAPFTLPGVLSPPYGNQQLPVAPTHSNDRALFCFGQPMNVRSFVPSTIGNEVSTETKKNEESGGNQKTVEESEKINSNKSEGKNDEKNEKGNKSDLSADEEKPVPLISNESEQTNTEKRRETHSNPRPRWKIGDFCLARWSEDGEFYYATVVQIRPPSCTVLFYEYNTYDQVTFNDMQVLPRDQPYYTYALPSIVPSTDFNPYLSHYYQPRTDYYSTMADGYLMMPEAPPFPFDSAGTPLMGASMYNLSTRSTGNGISSQHRRNDHGEATINSTSSTNKDSEENSAINDSTTKSSDQDDRSILLEKPEPSSVADSPLTTVISKTTVEKKDLTNCKDTKQELNEEEEK